MNILCVAPRFAPSNSPDSHRVRLLLPHLVELGHRVTVLAVDPADTDSPRDDWLAEQLPEQVRIHRVRIPARAFMGLRGLGQRAWFALSRAGDRLLAVGGIDLVFFSTTEFLLHGLGPRWRRRWGVPFCMDYQDPWVNDYYTRHPGVEPPGGRVKYAVKSWLDRCMEPRVVRRCSGFMAVSQAYLDDLERRYGEVAARQPQLVAGFPGEPAEFEGLPSCASGPGPACWRYVGRGGAVMATAARAFFGAWREAIARGLIEADAVRFEAVGTSYVSDEGPTVAPLAQAEGLAAEVREQTGRVGYRHALALLASSDALVVFGSDDPAYTASKIYPYLLSGRPVLAIFHAQSPIVPLIRAAGGAVLVTFEKQTPPEHLRAAILEAWFAQGARVPHAVLDRAAFEPYTAKAQAVRVAAWWREVITYAQ